MNIKTNTIKRYMKYEHYHNLPMQAVELKINEIIARKPHLIQSLDRTTINPSIRIYSHIPLNNYSLRSSQESNQSNLTLHFNKMFITN